MSWDDFEKIEAERRREALRIVWWEYLLPLLGLAVLFAPFLLGPLE